MNPHFTSPDEIADLRLAVSNLEAASLGRGGRVQIEAALDDISSLRRGASPETHQILNNLQATTTRQLLKRLPTANRADEDEYIAIFQLVWFRLLPFVIEEVKKDPSLLIAFDQFRASNETFRSTLFNLLGEKAQKYAEMVKRDA